MNSFNYDSVHLFRLMLFQMFDVDFTVGDRTDNKQIRADPVHVSRVSDQKKYHTNGMVNADIRKEHWLSLFCSNFSNPP